MQIMLMLIHVTHCYISVYQPFSFFPFHTDISKRKVNSTYVNNIKNIWDVEEVTERTHFDDFADPRPQPE